jgi:hypothetical protein
MQQSLYKSVREGEEPAQSSTEVDDGYVRATSGNRYVGEIKMGQCIRGWAPCSMFMPWLRVD